jgi:pimeloyl-ACP methyl ester carboxylesterase
LFAAAVLSSVLVSLAPAVRAARVDLPRASRGEAAWDPKRSRLRTALVAMQIGSAFIPPYILPSPVMVATSLFESLTTDYLHILVTIIRLLICLLMSFLPTAARAQAPVELTSITSTTNGVRVTWTDPGPGQAYTVQVRESLTSGNWRNGTTRYRWPWPFTHWADAPRSLPAARYYRVLAQPAPAPNRGKLLTSSLRNQIGTNTLNSNFASGRYAVSLVRAKFGIANRPFTYETVDPYGFSITNSALLILPIGTNGPLPLLSDQHGSLIVKTSAPSQPGFEEVGPSVFASYGYAVVVPDYLGLGSSPGYQAYLHARSEATCVVDALRAGRALCASNNVTLNGQLFLTGYSQGGHVTMAAHRELEAFHTNEFSVTASAPCAGPYDLGGVTIEEGLLANPNYPGPAFFLLMLASYLPIYQLGDTLEELLAQPYRRTLPPLLDGTHWFYEITEAMPTNDILAILRPDFKADFRTNVSNPLRQALLENNNCSWTPKAPVKMVHCQGDEIVTFANAEVAYQSFTNRGACCVSVVDPGAPAQLNHDDCYDPSLREVLAWFETFHP